VRVRKRVFESIGKLLYPAALVAALPRMAAMDFAMDILRLDLDALTSST